MLFEFDEVDETLDLVPMAARRALDRAGVRLPLEGWRSLPVDDRRAVAEAGSRAVIDVTPVLAIAARAHPAASRIEPVADPPADELPAEVAASFTGSLAVPLATWSALTPLARYALQKVAARGRPDRLAAAHAEIVGASALSHHLTPAGAARMVDVGPKPASARRAVAESRVAMAADAFERLVRNDAPKGDVLAAARVAGILAAKRTPELIPLCHPVSLSRVEVEIRLDRAARAAVVVASVEALDRTGVEMEALLAASTAALTIYDMLKAFDRAMQLGPTLLIEKSGGRSGSWKR
jgi:cyclic pyranopterin phosphate synthase